jgi:hypothetical protein
MKTEVIMKREFFGDFIQQKSHSEMFSANDIMLVGNKQRAQKGLSTKILAAYFDTQETKELINQIKWEFNLQDYQVKSVTKGRNGATWVHPLLFVDLAMWLSPELKVKVLKWVMDGLMELRDNSGDSFKSMNFALQTNFPKEFNNPRNFMSVANAIAKACGVYDIGADKWQLATKEQLLLRERIQNLITIYADVIDDLETCVNKAIQKEMSKSVIE